MKVSEDTISKIKRILIETPYLTWVNTTPLLAIKAPLAAHTEYNNNPQFQVLVDTELDRIVRILNEI